MKKRAFYLIIVAVTMAVAVYTLYEHEIIPHKKYTNADFGITQYVSAVDTDSDGIDDQTEILESVRAYIDTKPKYKSLYYAGGYPNDGYGVCTDVVAFGLLGAGYDLMTLVNEDIKNNPEEYGIESPDINIDFRRVRNLKVYFDHTAISLTTDVDHIDEWQGGDIVVFEGHIGIVSNNRNKHGVPFVIHHSGPGQIFYEQDILEGRDDIIGHYRIS